MPKDSIPDVMNGLHSQFIRVIIRLEIGTANNNLQSGYDLRHNRCDGQMRQQYGARQAVRLPREAHRPCCEYSESKSSYDRCSRNVIAVRVLLLLGARSVALKIAEGTLRIAEEFHFTDVLFELHALLGAVEFDEPDLGRKARSIEKTKQQLQLLHDESTSDEHIEELLMEFYRPENCRQSLCELSQRLYRQHSLLAKRSNGYRVSSNQYRLSVAVGRLQGDHKTVITACNEALEYLAKCPHVTPPSVIGEFEFYRLQASVELGLPICIAHEVDQILARFETCIGSWFLVLEFAILTFLHLGQYQRAFDTWNLGRNRLAGIEALPDTQLTWAIFEIHLYILEKLCLLEKTMPISLSTCSVPLPSLEHINSHIRKRHSITLSLGILITELLARRFDNAVHTLSDLCIDACQHFDKSESAELLRLADKVRNLMNSSLNAHDHVTAILATDSATTSVHYRAERNQNVSFTSVQIVPFDVIYRHIVIQLHELS